jgi:hypothetical protein
MAKPLITEVTTSQTFENWLAKTNEMVGIFKDEVMTASGSGDTTDGDATLTGIFTADNLVVDAGNGGDLKTDLINSASSSGTVAFGSPVEITAAANPAAIFNNVASGGQVRFTDGSFSWDVGIDDTQADSNFIIDTGVAPVKFELSTAGVLTIPSIVCTGTVTAASFVGASQFSDTDDVPEGSTNLYFTNARVGSALQPGVGPANVSVNYNASTDITTLNTPKDIQQRKISFEGSGYASHVRGTLDGANPVGQLRVTLAGSEYSTAEWTTGGFNVLGDLDVSGTAQIDTNLTVTGNITASGNVVTASDQRLKENLMIIPNSLDKLMSVNGYTFNKIGSDTVESGVIAQEVERVLPEVIYDIQKNDGVYKGVNYNGLIPLLLEAIKELKEKVEVLESRLPSE